MIQAECTNHCGKRTDTGGICRYCMTRTILEGDALDKLKEIESNIIDEMCTDPPYGYGFMNKSWDKSIVSVNIWKECLRVLKPGAFAFVMSAPRQDVLSHMIVNLSDAGFKTDFTSIYWAYATGFPKAANISKMVDKRNGIIVDSQKFTSYLKEKRLEKNLTKKEIDEILGTTTLYSWFEGRPAGITLPTKEYYLKLKKILDLDDRFDILIEREEAQREIIGHTNNGAKSIYGNNFESSKLNLTKSSTDRAKKLDGSYAGFQPKPAVEVILVCMKPLSEKNYVEQAMSNGKGVTWIDDCRIPYQSDDDKEKSKIGFTGKILDPQKDWNDNKIDRTEYIPTQGRFPANLLVSDDALNNESRYFDLDKWEAQFIITPKPSKSEKNKGLDNFIEQKVNDGRKIDADNAFQRGKTQRQNTHPTVKPVSLFKYLVTMGSRENDLVLDPFMGSGTTAIACEQTARDWIGIEKLPEHIDIFKARLSNYRKQNKLEVFS